MHHTLTDASVSDYGFKDRLLIPYKSVHLSVDIETADISKQENIKSENNNKGILSENNAVFNIGCVIALETNLKSPNLRINIVNTQASPSITRKIYESFAIKNQITIVTRNTRETLTAFTKLMSSIKPDFVYGYNSLDFDIPQIMLSLRYNNMFDSFYESVSLSSADRSVAGRSIYINQETGCEYQYNKSGYTYWCNHKTTAQVSGLSGTHKAGDIKLKINNGRLPEIKIKSNQVKYHEFDIPGIVMLDVMLISR